MNFEYKKFNLVPSETFSLNRIIWHNTQGIYKKIFRLICFQIVLPHRKLRLNSADLQGCPSFNIQIAAREVLFERQFLFLNKISTFTISTGIT